MVTTVPAGDWSVMSRSALNGWWRLLNTSTSVRYSPAPETSIVDVVAAKSAIGVDIVFDCDVVATGPQNGGTGGASAPARGAATSTARASVTRIVSLIAGPPAPRRSRPA